MERTVIEAKVSDMLDEIEELVARDNANEVTGYVMNLIALATKEDTDAVLALGLIGMVMSD